jgi:hypothetical protein
MLRSLKDITKNYKLEALDGEIGKINDFYFNDIFWLIKYLVADTGDWLKEQLVLLSPITLGSPDWQSALLPVNLTKDKIENSPAIEKHKPVSRQFEDDLMKYYAWPADFTYGIGSMNAVEMQLIQARLQMDQEKKTAKEKSEDPHLRSAREVMGYDIQATDGPIGHIQDFIIEDRSWIIHYIIVNTKNFLAGRQVIISPNWISKVDWADYKVYITLDKESVKNSPKFDPSDPVNKALEIQEYDYYGRPS